jgi:DNA-binding transcriptional ArsR family regulator
VQPRLRIAYGTAFDVAIAAAAVADQTWRGAFDAGPATHARALSVAGDDFVQRVAALGRFGWINLAEMMAAEPDPWDLGRLIATVRAQDPEDVHLVALGGHRRQLLDVVDEPTLRRGVRGNPDAKDRLVAALSSDDLVIEATPWLLGATSTEVQRAVVEVLHTWQELLLPAEAELDLASTLRDHADASRAVLATTSGRAYLDAAAGGLHYEPAGLDRVVSVSTTQVAPIVIVVDGRAQTLIVHPPLADALRQPDSRQRLLELARAVGDKTRMNLMTLLLSGEKTANELARGMHAPRTTLLHHLAILRAAGLIHVTVTPGGATVYRLQPNVFAELAEVSAEFVAPA